MADGFRGTDRFEVVSRLGEGGLGIVYEALDRERDTRVAIKTLRMLNAETLLLLKNEFRVVQDIRHPNLVELGELFVHEGEWFFSMELVPGTSLLEYVGDDEERLRASMLQLARGLAALHRANKVHRDVKPSNVRVTPDGRVVLLDFGIVSDLGHRSHADDAIMGTIQYMAPEQAGVEAVGPAADWYAFGVVLYRMLTGRLPFEGPAGVVLDLKTFSEPVPPRFIRAVPPDLDALCTALLHNEPGDRPSGEEILRRLDERAPIAVDPSSSGAIFVGRREELAALDRAYDDAATKGVTVVVEGESGVGKSFVVNEFVKRLLARDPTTIVLSGRCYQAESVPYKGFDGVVDGLVGVLSSMSDDERRAVLPDAIGLLARVFPVLSDLVEAPVSSNAVADMQQLRTRVFRVVRALFQRLAAHARLVLIIDDLQWADGDSIALLNEVMRPPRPPPLLVVAPMRAGGLDVARIPGDVRRLPVEQLPQAEAQELAGKLLAAAEGVSGGSTEIAEEAHGHPLFIAELVRRRLEQASSSRLKLDDALWARASRLSPEARRLLEVVALAGRPIRQSVAVEAAEIDPRALFSVTNALRIEHMVKTSGVHRDDSIEPYHDRVRESVVANLDTETSKRLHRRLGDALERAGDADPEALSVHFHGAGDTKRAAEYAEHAAEHAMSTLAFDRAARLFKLAAELSPERARAFDAKRAEALTNAGRWGDAADVRVALAKGAPPLEALDLRRLAAEQLMCSGRFDEGVALLHIVLSTANVWFPRTRFMTLLALIFHRILLRIRGLAFSARDPAALDPAELVRVDTARSAGAGFSMSDVVRGSYFQTRNLALSLRAGDAHRIARALSMEICFVATRGPRARARVLELTKTAESLVQSLDTPAAHGLAATAAGFTHFYRAEFKTAEEHLHRAETLLRDRCVGLAFELNSVRFVRYRNLSYLGAIPELAEQVPGTVREVEELGDRYTVVNLRTTAQTLLALASDDPDRARALLQETEPLLPRSGFVAQHYLYLHARAQLLLYTGAAKDAYALVHATWPGLRRSMMMRVYVIGVAALDLRARCAAAAAARESSPSVREALRARAEHDARTLAGLGTAWSVACSNAVRAALATTNGERVLAAGLLESTAADFDDLGLVLHAAAMRRRMGELAGDEAMIRAADATLRAHQVIDPAKFAAILASGFPA